MYKTNFLITFVIACQKANFWFCTQNYLLGVQNLIFDSQKQLKSAKNLFLQVLCTQKLVLDTQKLLLGTKPTICFFASNHKSYPKFCFWHVLDNFCRRRSDPLRSRSNTSKKFSAELWSLRALKNSPKTLSFHPLFNVLLFQNVWIFAA